MPAFGWATSGMVTASRMRSSAVRVVSGPTPQFEPTASAPSRASVRAAWSAATPNRVVACSEKVISTMTPMSGAASRAAESARRTSARLVKVSIRTASTPPSTSATICSRNPAANSGAFSLSSGPTTSPLGPTDPNTRAPGGTALRATWAPAALIFATSEASPCRRSFQGLAPNVLVLITSAPAARWAAWIARTRSGSDRFRSS